MPDKPIQGWQRQAARDYLIKNPDASMKDASKALNMGVRTIARARIQLVKEGILQPGRTGRIEHEGDVIETPVAPSSPVEEPSPTKKSKDTLLDSKALNELNDMLDRIEENEDDIESQKLMLKQVKRMAFDLRLHPDTRMSAMTLWTKLRDTVTSRVLGPGKPLNREAALDRLVMLFEAVGADLAIEAMYKAFGVTNEGKLPAIDAEATRSPAGTTEAPGSTITVSTHDSATGTV